MKKLISILLLMFIAYPCFTQENWEQKKKIDQLQKEYRKAVEEYLDIHTKLSQKQDKWTQIVQEKKRNHQWENNSENERAVRMVSRVENTLLWSPFEDPEDEDRVVLSTLVYKQFFKPNIKQIDFVLQITNKQEKLTRYHRKEMVQKMGLDFYQLVLESYNTTRNFVLILKEMNW